jgi:hypothetical protein
MGVSGRHQGRRARILSHSGDKDKFKWSDDAVADRPDIFSILPLLGDLALAEYLDRGRDKCCTIFAEFLKRPGAV